MAFHFKNTKSDIVMTEKDEEDSRINNICRFCEKEFGDNKVRDHCHLIGKYRGPVHNICNKKAKQNDNNFIPSIFHSFRKYDRHMFFKKLVDNKNDKVEFEIIPKTNEEYISVANGCIKFFDSNRFLSSSLDPLVKTIVDNSNKTMKILKKEIIDNDEILNIVNEILEEDETIKGLKKDYPDKIKKIEEAFLIYMGENDLKVLKTGFPDKWKFITKKLAYPYEFFNCTEDYQKLVDNLKEEDFFSKLKNDYPDHNETERTKQTNEMFNIKDGEELLQINFKKDILLLTCVFEKFIKVSVNEYGINPLYFVSLPAYAWQWGLKYTGINLQTLQDQDLILTIEIIIRGCMSSVMGDRYVKSDKNKKDIIYRC